MGTPTLYYVDPSIAGDSGTGVIGDPWGDLQYALNQATRDATNGDQFNIKAGTDEILVGALSFASYGNPTGAGPCIFRGYTSAANDGGVGGIDGNGGAIVWDAVITAVVFIDLHLHNGPSNNYIIYAFTYSTLIRCEVEGNVNITTRTKILNCHFHNFEAAEFGIVTTNYVLIQGCFIDGTDGAEPTDSYLRVGTQGLAVGNVVKTPTNSAKTGIYGISAGIIGNSVYCEGGGTGWGIFVAVDSFAINNIVEGYSGIGGEGIWVNSWTYMRCLAANAAYNNTINFYTDADADMWFEDNNDVLLSSPFTDPANNDFSVELNAGSGVIADGFPGNLFGTANYLDKGAAQAGSGRRSRIRIHGG